MKPSAILVVAAAALTPYAAQAQSSDSWMPEDMRATIGVRFWNTDWSSWFGNGSTYLHAGLENTVIPVASIRYKDFLVSGSYLLPKDFQFPVTGDPPTKRKEYDVNFGYFFLPGLAAVVGYKEIRYDVGSYNWSAKGPTLGLSGSAPLAPWTSLYANIAYGWPKLHDGGYAFNGAKGKYLLSETGLAFPLGALDSSMSGFVVTAGYRYQRLGAFPNGLPNFPDRELFEYTQGAVIGISLTL